MTNRPYQRKFATDHEAEELRRRMQSLANELEVVIRDFAVPCSAASTGEGVEVGILTDFVAHIRTYAELEA